MQPSIRMFTCSYNQTWIRERWEWGTRKKYIISFDYTKQIRIKYENKKHLIKYLHFANTWK